MSRIGRDERWRYARDRMRVLQCLLALSVASCDPKGLQDIGKGLLDPDKALLDTPGRKLASGEYTGLLIAGSRGDGGYIVAERRDLGDARIALVPYLEGEESCEYTPAYAYDRFSSRIDLDLPGVMSVQTDQVEGAPHLGTIRFIDYHCREIIDPIETAPIPQALFPAAKPRGMLVPTGDGELYFVDATKLDRKKVATDVTQASVAGSLLVTIELDQLVVRDEDFEEIARVGENVSGFVTTGGDLVPVLYQADGGFFTWNEEAGEQLVSEGGCSPVAFGSDTIAYYDPCDSRRLNVLLPSKFVGAPTEQPLTKLRGPEGVFIWSLRMDHGPKRKNPTVGELSFIVTPDASTTTGELVAITLPKKISPEEGVYDFEGETLAKDVSIVGGLYYSDYQDGIGTLLDVEHDEDGVVSGVAKLAERVAWVHPQQPYGVRGLIADYDGKVGNLIRLTKEEDGSVEVEVLGRNVPKQDIRADAETQTVAYLHDLADDGTGTLVVVDELGPYEVERHVLPDSVRFLVEPFGVVYLEDTGVSGEAELRAWLIESEIDLVIHEAVSRYLTVPWPAPGVLYAVPSGKDQGLWFAKAR